MKRRMHIISMMMLIIFSLTSITTYGETLTPSDTIREERTTQIISNGIVYQASNRLTTEGWVDIHILKVDLENPYISLDILRSKESFGLKDQLSDMANSTDDVVAGINGSFFNTSYNHTDPIGLEFEDGDYTSVNDGYNLDGSGAVSLIDGNQMFIDFIGANVSFTSAAGDELYIAGINQLINTTDSVVFNSNAASNTSEIESLSDKYKLVVNEGVVLGLGNPGQDVNIPTDGYVVVVPQSLSTYLGPFAIGTAVTLGIDTTISEEALKMVFSGGGKILENGQLVQATGLVVQPNLRHPRSAVGLTEDGRYLIAMVVDGRGESIGATHEELAKYLLEYDVKDAMHLDGGGSSTLIAARPGTETNVAYNDPSDGGERRIVNGLGFVSTAPTTESITVELIPSKRNMLLGESVEFELLAYDSNYNTVEIDDQDIFFMAQGITGTWDGLSYTPAIAGQGVMSCYFGNYSDSVHLNIYDTFYDIDAEPSVLSLNAGETGYFSVTGTSVGGYVQAVPENLISYQVSDTTIGNFSNGEFIPTGKNGFTKVVISSGGRSLTTYVTVGVQESIIGDFEEQEDIDTLLSMARLPSEAVEPVDQEAQAVLDLQYVNESNKMSLNPTISNTGANSVHLSYHIDPTDIYENKLFVGFNEIFVDKPINQVDMFADGITDQLALSVKITDDNGDVFELPMALVESTAGSTWNNYEANIITMAYPITIDGVYLEYFGTELGTGVVMFDSLISTKAYANDEFMFDYEPFIDDPLMQTPLTYDEQISLFGATAGRNRLLDDVVLDKVYEEMNEADSVHFTGWTNIDYGEIEADLHIWDDMYRIIDYADVRVIELATGQGGLFDTDMSQWERFEADLASTYQDNVIIIADKDPRTDFNDQREGELLQEILEEYVAKTGLKQVFYVTASGYDFDVEYVNGVRYITVNGLWYHINDNKINLHDTFYIVDFYVSNHKLYYDVRNIYPKIEVE